MATNHVCETTKHPWVASKISANNVLYNTTHNFQKRIISNLNKITPAKFSNLANRTMDIIQTTEQMDTALAIILKFAVSQPIYCPEYVRLCKYFYDNYADQAMFRKTLIVQMNTLYATHKNHNHSTDTHLTSEQSEQKKCNFFATLVLLSELYNFELVKKNLIYRAIFDSLLPPKNKTLSSVDIEGLCLMLQRCGEKLDQTSKKLLDKYMQKLCSHVPKFDFRTQVLVDLIKDVRNRNWSATKRNWWEKKPGIVNLKLKVVVSQKLNPPILNAPEYIPSKKKIDPRILNAPAYMPTDPQKAQILDAPEYVPTKQTMYRCDAVEDIPEQRSDPVQINRLIAISEDRLLCEAVTAVNVTSDELKSAEIVTDDRLYRCEASVRELDNKLQSMAQNITIVLNSFKQKSHNGIKATNQHFTGVITTVCQQMSQEMQTLSTKLLQNQKYAQQNIAQLQQSIVVLTQQQLTKDIQLKRLLQEIDELKRNGNTIVEDDQMTEKEKVKQWLTEKLRLPQYFELFVENGCDDLDTIAALTKGDIKEMGIGKIGHAKKIMKYIKLLSRNENYEIENEQKSESFSSPLQQSQSPIIAPKTSNSQFHNGQSSHQIRHKDKVKKIINWGHKKRILNSKRFNDRKLNIFYLNILCSSSADCIYASLGFAEIVRTLVPICNRALYKWIRESAPVFSKLSISNWSLELGSDFVIFIGNKKILSKDALFRYKNPYGLKQLSIQCDAVTQDWLHIIGLKQLAQYLQNKQNLEIAIFNTSLLDAQNFPKYFSEQRNKSLIYRSVSNAGIICELPEEFKTLFGSLVTIKKLSIQSLGFKINFFSVLPPLVTDLRLYDSKIVSNPNVSHFLFSLKNRFFTYRLQRLGVGRKCISLQNLGIMAGMTDELIIKNTPKKKALDVQSLAVLFAEFSKIEVDASLMETYPSIQNQTKVETMCVHSDKHNFFEDLLQHLPSSVQHLIIKRGKLSSFNLGFTGVRKEYNTHYLKELTLEGFNDSITQVNDDILQIVYVVNSNFFGSLKTVNIVTESYRIYAEAKQKIESMYLSNIVTVNVS